MTLIRFAIPALALLVACEEEQLNCTDLAAASTLVTVVDTTGASIDDATVQWSTGGGARQGCDPGAPGEWICGYEVEELTIHVSKDGYASVDEDVSVPSDECHVIQQDVEIELALQET